MRAFIAIELDSAARAAVADFVDGLPRLAGVRSTAPAQLHVTLKFLGEIDVGAVPRVVEIMSLASAGIPPFEIVLHGLGGFPSAAAPRILWLGIEDRLAGAARWLAVADPLFAQLDIPAEGRPLQLHVTLARSKTPASAAALGSAARRRVVPPPRAMLVRELALFESVLTPAGARHTLIRRLPLSPA